MGFLRKFKNLDLYREVPKDLTEQTVTGACGRHAYNAPCNPISTCPFFLFLRLPLSTPHKQCSLRNPHPRTLALLKAQTRPHHVIDREGDSHLCPNLHDARPWTRSSCPLNSHACCEFVFLALVTIHKMQPNAHLVAKRKKIPYFVRSIYRHYMLYHVVVLLRTHPLHGAGNDHNDDGGPTPGFAPLSITTTRER